jgi:5-methylthioribose kinase
VIEAGYKVLDAAGVRDFIAGIREVRRRLGGKPPDWRVSEVGDGNLNLVFIVEGPEGSACLKQALPYVRAAGPAWPMSPDRARFENSYFEAVAPHVGALIPAIYHFEPELHCTVMERLSPHIILRHGLIAGRRYPKAARDIGEYIALASFFTSDLARPFERKLEGMATFAGNTPLIRITVDLIFAEPYFVAARNRHTTPQLDGVAAGLRRDRVLKLAAARLGEKFLTQAQALVHGDLHSGSVMVTEHDSRVIDPEFAFYGPIGFDLGAFIGNLLLSWYSQPGHATREDDRGAYQQWILEEARTFWQAFHNRFAALWSEHRKGDLYPSAMFHGEADSVAKGRDEYLAALFADMLGFAACKMIRRIIGFAHVLDLESIRDPDLRAQCETAALTMAATLLKSPERFRTIDDVLEAVPQVSPRPRALRS